MVGQSTIDTANVHRLLAEARTSLNEVNYLQADSLANAALEVATSGNYTIGKARCFRMLGFSCEMQSDWKNAYLFYIQSLETWQSIPDNMEIGKLCRDICFIKEAEGDYIEQLKFAKRGFVIFEAIPDMDRMGDFAIEVANANKNLGRHDQAGVFFWKAANCYNIQKDTLREAIAKYGLGDLFYKNYGVLDSARIHIRESLLVFIAHKDTARAAQGYNVLGAICQDEENYPEALKNYHLSNDWAKEVEDTFLQFDAYLNLTQIEIYRSNYNTAKSYYSQAEKLLGDSGSVLDKERLLRMEFGLEILRLEEQKRKGVYFMSILAMLLMFFVGWIYLLKQKQKAKQKANDFILRESQLKHEKQTIELINEIDTVASKSRETGAWEERAKIKKLVHNEIGSQLAATKWRLQTLKSGMGSKELYREELTKIEEMTSKAYKHSRNIERLLDQKQTDWLGEISSFFEILSSKVNKSKPQITFHSQGIENNLPTDQGHLIFQIFKIATANTLAYANANLFTCQLSQVEDELIILIEDDGKGFNPSMPREGTGLDNLKELAIQLNGQAQIDSGLGKGTTITITIPLRK
ncbi:MAG: hypothetical protein DHS20C18_44530 [Saprospiraceae bacterium]|nr:MAG: hypothetical protein DHS20C18_44530 [Saprospiraceae bacterium]